MCKHVLNAQVAIRSQCCKLWFDCPECHAETQDHPLAKVTVLVMACKKCKKVFRKDMSEFEEEDEYCPHCDNHYVLEAKTQTQKPVAPVSDSDARMIRGGLTSSFDPTASLAF